VVVAGLCIVIPFILLNAPHYQRNLTVFANPLSSGEDRYFNEGVSAGTLLSNLVRNTALQLSSPSDGLNRLLYDGVASTHRLLQIDINDPKTTWPDTEFGINRLSRHEDSSGNFLHVLVAFAALVMIGFSRTFRQTNKTVLIYAVVVAAGFSLFCLMLKWQPWHSRLLLPLFVLGAPVVGIIAVRCWKPVVVSTLALTLLLAAVPWAFSNNSRALVYISGESGITFPLLAADRNALYFANRGDLYPRYAKVAGEIQRSKVTSLGLIMASRDVWEYPLWVLIRQGHPIPVRIEHIEVTNASRVTATVAFRPEAQVRLD